MSAELSSALLDALLVERFWAKTMPEPNSGCWLWMFAVDEGGYGKFQITNHGAGPKQFHVRAHRFALALRLGKWPGDYVLHRCDNPCCCNPDHLREGTQKENIADMDRRARRGRKPLSTYLRGDKHPLRADPARAARGERHGSKVHPESVCRGARNWRAILNDDLVRSLRALKGTKSADEAAAIFGIRKGTVYSVWSRRSWRHI